MTLLHLTQIYKLKRNEIEAAIKSGKYNLNEQDSIGNTFLHDVVEDWDFRIALILLQLGADPNIRNNKKQTAIDVFFLAYPTVEYKTLEFLQIIQDYYPDSSTLIHFLNKMPAFDTMYSRSQVKDEFGQFKNCYHLSELIRIDKLPVETLKDLLRWTEYKIKMIENAKNPFSINLSNSREMSPYIWQEFSKKLTTQIKFHTNYPGLTAILNIIINANEKTKNILFRAMLLNQHPFPLRSLLSEIGEEDEKIFPYLEHYQHQKLTSFINLYETKKSAIEELNCIPNPLTQEEITIVEPIYKQLDSSYHDQYIQGLKKSFEEQMIKADDMIPERKQMIVRFNQYQKEDKNKRQSLFVELLKRTEEIQQLDPNLKGINDDDIPKLQRK